MGNLSKRLGLEQPPQDPKLKGVPDAAVGRVAPKSPRGADVALPGVSLAAFEALEGRVSAVEARLADLDRWNGDARNSINAILRANLEASRIKSEAAAPQPRARKPKKEA